MSFNDYLQERFEGIEGTDELRDITRHGLSGGVSGFIYYNELKQLFIEHEDEILDYCIEECGVTLSDLAVDCICTAEIALNAVWMFVEGWAHREYENRMTTLEELNDDNMEHLIEEAVTNPATYEGPHVTLQEYLDSPHGKEHMEIITC